MTTVYVQRSNGKLTSVYYADQPGMNLSAMDDQSEEVRDFLNPILTDTKVSVSARQFKLQLFYSGLKSAVDAWVSQQTPDVQIAYEYSGEFVKDSPMMVLGFAAMGFTAEQRDTFFEEAAKL